MNREIISVICDSIATAGLCWLCYWLGTLRGRLAGYKRGALDRDVTLQQAYELGRKSGDNWWMGVEAEIEQERRKLWEQEKGKKRA